MHTSRILSASNHLYLICDGELCAAKGISLADYVTGALKGDCKTIQYRHKGISAREYEQNLLALIPRCAAAGAKLIVNDFAELAQKHALPLHLGQDDALPANLTVPYGRSTHSLTELDWALGANPAPDYVALGKMFDSATKPDVANNRQLVNEYLKRTDLPLVLIGGITLDNVHELPQSERIHYAVIGDAFRFGVNSAGIAKFVRSFTHELLAPSVAEEIHGQKG